MDAKISGKIIILLFLLIIFIWSDVFKNICFKSQGWYIILKFFIDNSELLILILTLFKLFTIL